MSPSAASTSRASFPSEEALFRAEDKVQMKDVLRILILAQAEFSDAISAAALFEFKI